MRTGIVCLLSAGAVLCGGRCAWAQAGRFIPMPGPPAGGGSHVPLHFPGLEHIGGHVCWLFLAVVALIGLAQIGWHVGQALGGGKSRPRPATAATGPAPDRLVPPPDRILDRAEVSAKAEKTTHLLEALARRDGALHPEALRAFIADTFLRVQQCWQARDYGPVRERLGPGLLAEHEGLLRQMREGHEINRIEGLRALAVDFVHLSYPGDPDGREVAALVTFEATAYFVDDRDGRYTRGRRTPGLFQEFWVFRRRGEHWRLAAIERTHQSGRLRAANHVAGLSPGHHPE
jgi:hypothetical protein